MKDVISVLKENITHLGMIARIARYEDKANYQSHYLGLLWQYLNPAIQVGIYFIIFGLGLQRHGIGGVPYILWMLIGIVPWFFMSQCFTGMSRSIFSKIGTISKMKFPVSILPTINMVSNLTSYFAMMVIVLIMLFCYHTPISLYWLQYFYYVLCMFALIFSLGILNSTISVIIRDYHVALQSVNRILFYISGVILNINDKNYPPLLRKIFSLNPFNYVIKGFRETFVYKKWFFDDPIMMIYFWSFVLLVLIIGCHLHMKFRNRFIDFI
ncbi:ABC transporter permease [Catellicoccus marimammalium]|uniref:ABC transporter permease n=1 Tax=Catellicoccus marimammalium TaxID=300419 RepID=UPI00058F8FAC|nr:ABC transporter permease [Catellicoccus marimammalium]